MKFNNWKYSPANAFVAAIFIAAGIVCFTVDGSYATEVAMGILGTILIAAGVITV